jgi:uncharacterized YigZ family protein
MTMAEKNDIYYTIESKERVEIKIKASRFIASATQVIKKEDAIAFLKDIQSEFHDARHNCFAYKLGPEGMEYRYSDDGEPNGTGGKPILFSIQKHNVSDVLVVVTRYFGGVKLGVGGLARAYGDAAHEVLKIAKKRPVYIIVPVRVFCTYEDIDPVKRIVGKMAITFEEEYHDAVEMLANIPRSKVDEFTRTITSATNGRAGTVVLNRLKNIQK